MNVYYLPGTGPGTEDREVNKVCATVKLLVRETYNKHILNIMYYVLYCLIIISATEGNEARRGRLGVLFLCRVVGEDFFLM